MAQSIAITGRGIVCAIGSDCDEVLAALLDKKSGVAPIRHLHSTHSELPVGEVAASDPELKRLLGLDEAREVSRTSLLGALALRQSLEEAGIRPEAIDPDRTLFISGTTVGGMDVTERHYPRMRECDESARHLLRHDCGANTSEIAELCGLKAREATISTACSSALNSIILGAKMLLSGEADIAICGGSEALSRFHLNGFNSLMILDTERCRPFDATRRGLNLGEGAAFVVLERQSDAQNRNARILGYVGGYGNRCDAFHQTATSPEGVGAKLAMQEALQMASLQPGDIDYINAHGTGTPDNDSSESAAMRDLFGEALPPVSSTKSYTGHTTSASGSIETVISLLAMHHKFIPGALASGNPDPDCIVPTTGATDVTLHNVVCNSFGFGGNDSSLVITDAPVLLPEIAECETEIIGECEINSTEELAAIRQYAKPIEARRMSRILKASIISSMRALEEAGIEAPDAIIIGTKYGMLEQGEKILDHIESEGEQNLSPTLFMQSTHNTIAGTLAIRLGCHGYNITYSHGEDSFALALRDAQLLIAEGKAQKVLVGVHEACPDGFREIYHSIGEENAPEVYSRSVVVSKKITDK